MASIAADQEALTELPKPDGCYALAPISHQSCRIEGRRNDRYKDLARVEWAFRDSKSVHLEMRPVYLRAENRTRGHALVVMLAYIMMAQESWWCSGATANSTVQAGLDLHHAGLWHTGESASR